MEKYPKDSPSTTIPVSDDLAVAMTNGCYQSLQSMNLYNQRIWSMDICAGDSEAGGDPSTGTDGVETKEVANFYATPSNNLAVGLWRGGYTGIGNCNTAIQSLSANADNISPEILTRSLGEAYFYVRIIILSWFVVLEEFLFVQNRLKLVTLKTLPVIQQQKSMT